MEGGHSSFVPAGLDLDHGFAAGLTGSQVCRGGGGLVEGEAEVLMECPRLDADHVIVVRAEAAVLVVLVVKDPCNG